MSAHRLMVIRCNRAGCRREIWTPCDGTREARDVAEKEAGWLVGVMDPTPGSTRTLDYCPDHKESP